MYSTTESTSHMREAPQNIRARVPSLRSAFTLYHAIVEMMAANAVISNVMSGLLTVRHNGRILGFDALF